MSVKERALDWIDAFDERLAWGTRWVFSEERMWFTRLTGVVVFSGVAFAMMLLWIAEAAEGKAPIWREPLEGVGFLINGLAGLWVGYMAFAGLRATLEGDWP